MHYTLTHKRVIKRPSVTQLCMEFLVSCAGRSSIIPFESVYIKM
jgi:hypothetical protein